MKKTKHPFPRLLVFILVGLFVLLLSSEKQAVAKSDSDGHQPSNPSRPECKHNTGFCITGTTIRVGYAEDL